MHLLLLLVHCKWSWHKVSICWKLAGSWVTVILVYMHICLLPHVNGTSNIHTSMHVSASFIWNAWSSIGGPQYTCTSVHFQVKLKCSHFVFPSINNSHCTTSTCNWVYMDPTFTCFNCNWVYMDPTFMCFNWKKLRRILDTYCKHNNPKNNFQIPVM